MAEIINLRLARKARDRRKAEAAAATNRARHGQTGAQRRQATAEVARLHRIVDGAHRDGNEACREGSAPKADSES